MKAPTSLRRMLILDGILVVVGFASLLGYFLISIDAQRQLTERLYQHPFQVSNATIDFRMQTLSMRTRMLELANGYGNIDLAREEIDLTRLRLNDDLAIIERQFLGDPGRIADMKRDLSAWYGEQDLSFADIVAGHPDAARSRISLQIRPLVARVLYNAAYVNDFAQKRARDFSDEAQVQFQTTQKKTLIGFGLFALVYAAFFIKRAQIKQRLFTELHERATIDELTGAWNRKTFFQHATTELARTSRTGQTVSVLALDIDHFKGINDHHGHAAGDAVLRAFGVRCRETLRSIDVLGRVGGEEFAIVLPGATHAQATTVAERIRHAIEHPPFALPGKSTITVTVSVGVAQMDSAGQTIDQLLSRADQAMYVAKHHGRNCVIDAANEPLPDSSPLASPVA
jgi:diguanylate cyclase (GGDEF)-like protein